jgi:hypothetical protein
MSDRFALALAFVCSCHAAESVPSKLHAAASTGSATHMAVEVASAAPSAHDPAAEVQKPAHVCGDARAFTFDESIFLPKPFDALTPCDAMVAVYRDYDRTTERSAIAKGTVRLYSVQRWETAGATFLAMVYYAGEDASEQFVCGQCRVDAQLAILKLDGTKLKLVAKTHVDASIGSQVTALFSGLAELDLAPVAVDETTSLLAMRTNWSTGMPGSWRMLSLYRLQGTSLTRVFNGTDRWFANGMGADDDIVSSEMTTEARPKGNGLRDLRIVTSEQRCKERRVLRASQAAGFQRLLARSFGASMARYTRESRVKRHPFQKCFTQSGVGSFYRS